MNSPSKKTLTLHKDTRTKQKKISTSSFFHVTTFHNIMSKDGKSSIHKIREIISHEATSEHARFKNVEGWIDSWLISVYNDPTSAQLGPLTLNAKTVQHIRDLYSRKLLLFRERPKKKPLPTTHKVRKENVLHELCHEIFNMFHTSYTYTGGGISNEIHLRPQTPTCDKSLSKRIQSAISFFKVDTIDEDLKSLQNDEESFRATGGVGSFNLVNQRVSNALIDFLKKSDVGSSVITPSELPNTKHTIWIRVDELFLNGMLEPIYGSLALHNISTKKKVSETFHFSCNKAISHSLHMENCQSLCFGLNECIFTYRSHDIESLYLIIRIEKTLEKSSLSKFSQFYVNIPDSKALNSQRSHVSKFIPNLYPYRTFFGYIFLPIKMLMDKEFQIYGTVDAKSKLVSVIKSCETISSATDENQKNSRSKRFTFNQFYIASEGFTDDVIYKYIQDSISSQNNQKKVSTINACLTMVTTHFENLHLHDSRNIEEIISLAKQPSDMPSISENVIFLKNISSHEKFPNISYFNNLYLYPKTLNFSKSVSSFKNLQLVFYFLEKEPDDILTLFKPDNKNAKNNLNRTIVTYSDRNPIFYDEIKFELPRKLTTSQHVLIGINSISISKSFETTSTIVAYTWFPILQNITPYVGLHELPVTGDLSSGYSKTTAMDCMLPLKWFDNKKPVLSVKVRLKSSVNPNCVHLKSLFDSSLLVKPISKSIENIDEFVDKLSLISNIHSDKIIKNFPILFNFFLSLIDEIVSLQDFLDNAEIPIRVSEKVFVTFVELVYLFYDSTKYMRNPQTEKNEWISEYIELCCFNKKIADYIIRGEYDSLSKTEPASKTEYFIFNQFTQKFIAMILLLSQNDTYKSKIIMTLSVYLDLILKYMIIENFRDKKLQSNRPSIDQSLVNLLEQLIVVIFDSLKTFSEMKSYAKIKYINDSVADFLFSLFYVVERGFVLHLINVYSTLLMSWDNEHAPLYAAKFLSIFLRSEEIMLVDMIFLLLKNIKPPCQFDSRFIFYLHMDDSLMSDHYLFVPWLRLLKLNFAVIDHKEFCGNYIEPLASFLCIVDEIGKANDKNSNILEYSNVSTMVAICLYPLIDVLQTNDFWTNDRLSARSSEVSLRQAPSYYATVNSKTASKFLEEARETPENPVVNRAFIKRRFLRAIFLLYLWIIRASGVKFLDYVWKNWSAENKIGFIGLIYSCVNLFPHKDSSTDSERSSKLDDLKDFILRGLVRDKSIDECGDFKIRTFAKNKSNRKKQPSIYTGAEYLYRNCIIFNETTLYIVHNILNITDDSVENRQIMAKIIELVTLLLSNKRSTTFHGDLLSIIHHYLPKICQTLFIISHSYAANLVKSLIIHCKSSYQGTREKSAGVIHSLFLKNYQLNKNLSIMQAVLASSISEVVANEQSGLMTANLKSSINDIVKLSEKEDFYFKNRLINITQTLLVMIEENDKLTGKNMSFHGEIDSMYKIAALFYYVPEIRIDWLSRIEKTLTENSCDFQAGLCCLRCAMIIMQYLLAHNKNHYFFPYNFHIFDKIISDYHEEGLTFEIISETINVSQSYFTIEGFQQFIRSSITYFSKTKVYWIVVLLCDLLNATYRNTSNLVNHAKLLDTYSTSLKYLEKTQDFLEPAFFRVVFYSNSKIDEDGEYIYHEAPHTKLPDFIANLEKNYSKLLPKSINIEIIRDCILVDKSTLSPNTFYIQVTSVAPYITDVTSSEYLHHSKYPNYRFFYYYRPFTASGSTRGELIEQYQLQTILETESFFPSIKLREKIISTREVTLKPIQVIQLDISKRAFDLEKVVHNEESVNLKMLQLNLQGCIAASVNQGPMEAAKTFLVPFVEEKVQLNDLDQRETMIYLQSINKLVLTFQSLTTICKRAIFMLEKNLSNSETAYLEHMNGLFNDYEGKITPLLQRASDRIFRMINVDNLTKTSLI